MFVNYSSVETTGNYSPNIQQNIIELDKVPSGGTYTPNQYYCLFLKSTKYVAFTLEMAFICYINTTLKEFSHTLCEVHDLDLKGKAWVHGSC